MKVLCLFGEHQYGDPFRGQSLEATSFIPALRNLEHHVEIFDTWNRGLYTDLSDLNLKLVQYVDRFRPQVAIFIPMTYEVWTETIEILRHGFNVATIMWCTDDTWKLRETSVFYAPHVDLVATTYTSAVKEYERRGFDHIVQTQWAADFNRMNRPKPAVECGRRVTFVGQATSSRRKAIAALEKAGVQVECYGHGWPNGSLEAHEVYGVMHDSMITLNFADSHKGGHQLKARNFEAPGAGTLLLTEHVPGLDEVFAAGREIATFRTLKECAEKIHHYLGNPDERDAVAAAGVERVWRDHTYEARLNILVTGVMRHHSYSQTIADARWQERFAEARDRHTLPWWMRLIRGTTIFLCRFLFTGKRRRAARRIIFELSWRLAGAKTYSAAGWPGRMFPHD